MAKKSFSIHFTSKYVLFQLRTKFLSGTKYILSGRKSVLSSTKNTFSGTKIILSWQKDGVLNPSFENPNDNPGNAVGASFVQ